jgi:hypothetical protein
MPEFTLEVELKTYATVKVEAESVADAIKLLKEDHIKMCGDYDWYSDVDVSDYEPTECPLTDVRVNFVSINEDELEKAKALWAE